MVVAVATALMPLWALAGNQEVAEQIGASLRSSGQIHGYKIGVKFQDGTAWLRGTVATQAQMDAALKIVSHTPGVKNVVNNMTIAGEGPESAGQLQQVTGAMAPERSRPPMAADLAVPQAAGANNRALLSYPTTGRVEPVATSFDSRPVQPAGVEEPAPGPDAVSPATTRFTGMAQPQTQSRSLFARPGQPIPMAMVQNTAPGVGMAPGSSPAAGMMPGSAMPGAPGMAPGMGMVPGSSPTAGMMQAGPMPGAPGMVPGQGGPIPQYAAPAAMGAPAGRYDQPYMPNYAWPGYAAYPNYAALTYPKQYSPTAWPYIGPFYPYPQVPLGWRKVTMQWHDGWWFLDFDDGSHKGPLSGVFRPLSWH
jgi:hypothetical protein